MRAGRSASHWLVLATLLAATGGVWAAAITEAAEIDRIRRERQAAEAQYAKAAEACRKEFAVTACMDKARGERRAARDRLRQAEIVIDDERRRTKAAARTDAVARKTQAAAQPVAREASSPVDGGKVTRPAVGGKAARSPASGASATPKPHAIKGAGHEIEAQRQAAATQAARRASDARAQQTQLARHRQDVLERNAAQAKKHPPAAGLPTPIAPASSAR
jgi:hypothetical protein